ncbi:hypothetical protein G6F62_015068 [Rhizopus arrhizus]|nr:hypothetical protein G6F31_021563 [Rhizopus arrhizus]KAG1302899.1 hypothetical protein G6F63_016705 [Rhizopus arrhizus]KAG1308276.1 hypothetical protein G6F62_015068 [Rhizopus arrhizus]KAG1370578.1 hypothetical protein G6F60_015656 [Rhizopus arrhizus]
MAARWLHAPHGHAWHVRLPQPVFRRAGLSGIAGRTADPGRQSPVARVDPARDGLVGRRRTDRGAEPHRGYLAG